MAKPRTVTPVFRVSFPQLHEPRAFQQGQAAKYGATMMFTKDTDLSGLRKLHDEAIEYKWKGSPPKSLRSPFRDGSEKADEWEGFGDDIIFVRATANEDYPPQVFDHSKNPINDPSHVYAGSYGRASVGAYAYDHAGNRGVAFEIYGYQKVADGEPIGSRRDTSEDFGEIDPAEIPAVATDIPF